MDALCPSLLVGRLCLVGLHIEVCKKQHYVSWPSHSIGHHFLRLFQLFALLCRPHRVVSYKPLPIHLHAFMAGIFICSTSVDDAFGRIFWSIVCFVGHIAISFPLVFSIY